MTIPAKVRGRTTQPLVELSEETDAGRYVFREPLNMMSLEDGQLVPQSRLHRLREFVVYPFRRRTVIESVNQETGTITIASTLPRPWEVL